MSLECWYEKGIEKYLKVLKRKDICVEMWWFLMGFLMGRGRRLDEFPAILHEIESLLQEMLSETNSTRQ